MWLIHHRQKNPHMNYSRKHFNPFRSILYILHQSIIQARNRPGLIKQEMNLEFLIKVLKVFWIIFQAVEVEKIILYEHCSLGYLDQGICKPDLGHPKHKFVKRKCITNPTAYKFNSSKWCFSISPAFNTLEILGLINDWIPILLYPH